MAKKKNATIREASAKYEYLTGDEELRRIAFLKEKYELDHISSLEFAREQGEEIGQRRGEEIGQKRGEEIGQKRGEEIGQRRGEKIGQRRGEEIGQKRGEEIGQRRGEEIGQKRGEKVGQKNEKINIARNLLKLKIPIEQIIEATNLSKVELESLMNIGDI